MGEYPIARIETSQVGFDTGDTGRRPTQPAVVGRVGCVLCSRIETFLRCYHGLDVHSQVFR